MDERVRVLEIRVVALESALAAKDDAITVLTHALADLSRQMKAVDARSAAASGFTIHARMNSAQPSCLR